MVFVLRFRTPQLIAKNCIVVQQFIRIKSQSKIDLLFGVPASSVIWVLSRTLVLGRDHM